MVASNRYRIGYSSDLEELDAQRTFLTVQQNVLQIRTSLLVASLISGGRTEAAERTENERVAYPGALRPSRGRS